MKTVLMVSIALGLTGCAMPISHLRANDMAQASPEWELCYVAVSGRGQQSIRNAVYAEIDRRKVDCSQHMPMVLARMQQDGINAANANAQAQMGLQMMNAARPKPMPLPQQTNCRSVVNGNVVNTVCN
jgi:hypothetical protein